jgi:hypothetical protein
MMWWSTRWVGAKLQRALRCWRFPPIQGATSAAVVLAQLTHELRHALAFAHQKPKLPRTRRNPNPPTRKPSRLRADQMLEYFLSDLNELELYVAFQRRWHGEEQERYESHLQREEDSDDDERYRANDHHARLHESFPQMSRHMIVVYAFSALEDTLTEFCFAVQNSAVGLPEPRFSRNGSALDGAKDYLNGTRIKFPSDTTYWSALRAAHKARNMLTHGLGYLDADPATAKFAECSIERRGTGVVERFARNQLLVNDLFIAELIANMRRLCTELRDRYRSTYATP